MLVNTHSPVNPINLSASYLFCSPARKDVKESQSEELENQDVFLAGEGDRRETEEGGGMQEEAPLVSGNSVRAAEERDVPTRESEQKKELKEEFILDGFDFSTGVR